MLFVNLGGLGTKIPLAAIPELNAANTRIDNDLEVRGALSLSDGVMVQPVSFGLPNSAATGFRHVEIPNTSGSALLTSLVSYWKFDETTGTSLDSVGANHLAVTAGV